jgi:hypothetical protein
LVSKIYAEEARWRLLGRWTLLLVALLMPVVGYCLDRVLRESSASWLYFFAPVLLGYVIAGWRGDAKNQLLLSLAKRIDE